MSNLDLHHDYIMAKHELVRDQVLLFEKRLKDLGEEDFAISRDGNPEIPTSQIILLEALLHFRKCGQQSFMIGPNLQDMFCETSLQSVPREALKMPYQCFYLALPDCPWEVWGDENTGWHPIGGAYVRHDTVRNKLTLAVWGMCNEKSVGPKDFPHSWCEVDLDECFVETGDLEHYFDRLFDPNDLARIDNDHVHGRPSALEGDPNFETDLKGAANAFKAIYRIAINLILYLQTETADLTSRPRRLDNDWRRRLGIGKKKFRNLNPIMGKGTITVVGREIEKDMEETKRRLDAAGSTRMHWRRGHWHGYWTGPKGDQKLVQKWLMPMLVSKGAEEMASSRRYEIADPPDQGPLGT